MKKVVFLVLLILLSCTCLAFAEEEEATEETESESKAVYEFPKIAPEGFVWGGYRLLHQEGSRQAGKYEYFGDSFPGRNGSSIIGGGLYYAIPFPHRIAIEGGYFNNKDFYGDARYAYQDLVLLRLTSRSVFHNLPNTLFTGSGTAQNDEGVVYGVKTSINKYTARLKMPNFPLHVYFEGRIQDRTGSEQARFVGGTGFIDQSALRVSQSRDIKWNTNEHTVGMNAHLGPLELDMSHSERIFKPRSEDVLTYSYSSLGPSTAGIYDLNQIPRLESSSNTLRLHTLYHSKILFSGMLSNIHTENTSSQANSKYWVGQGELLWIPLVELTFAGKYRHQVNNYSNPDALTVFNLSNPGNQQTFGNIKDSIDWEEDKVSASVTYRPIMWTALKIEYTHNEKNRNETQAEEWHLPSFIKSNSYDLTATTKVLRSLKLTARFVYKETEEDKSKLVYDFEPKNSNQEVVSLVWQPVARFSALLRYSRAEDETNEMQNLYADPKILVSNANNRESVRQRHFAGFTVRLMDNLSLSPSYTYMRTDIIEDIVWATTADTYEVDKGVRYKAAAYNYAVNLTYSPMKNLNLNLIADYTKTDGAFFPRNPLAASPVSLASFSQVKTRELAYHLDGRYTLRDGWGIGMTYKYTDLRDYSPDNPESGHYNLAAVTLSKKW